MTRIAADPAAVNPVVPGQTTAAAAALPLRESAEIQGDILAGFKKDYVQLLFLTIGDPVQARRWLARLRHRIATTRDVAAFNATFSAARRNAAGTDPASLRTVWRSVSFTYPGLEQLVGGPPIADVPNGTTQDAFVQGAAARKELLGDTEANDPSQWLFGAQHSDPVHVVLTVAADRAADLGTALAREREEIAAHRLAIAFEQAGATLEGHRRGEEHFGFKDGISQPAVADFDEPDPARPEYQKDKPGTRIIPSGEFVVGHPTDHRRSASLPDWMADGSFQVVRRLAQDVPGWWAQVADQLKVLKDAKAVPDTATTEWLAARLFGRWRSGAPVAKSPDVDVPTLPGADADNDISYRDDPDGRITPLCSHARKVNPRDGLKVRTTDPEPLAEKGALDGRRLMRRGIPYGMPFDPAGGEANGPDAPRGLVFVSYQADLVQQFEFVQRTWIEGADFPERSPQVGRDAVIGRGGQVAFPSGGTETPTASVELSLRQFVRTEGCVYAFTPSLPALKQLADGTIPPGGGPAKEQVLTAPELIQRGDVISSHKARLRFNDLTGNLVVHDENEREIWSTGLDPALEFKAVRAEFTADGELLLPNTDGEVLWPPEGERLGSHPGAVLVGQTDGDGVIRAADGSVLWHTGTAH
ncbi:Dyp-type peroxidase [Streptomyces specialis]|uniref:Dyp-type peroxidase n=1 Tax=Streptomyces specialis TaxID=498367 RepID=UPI00099EB657|nr:Dyp-type peroxidase [Streptomyces specialis]